MPGWLKLTLLNLLFVVYCAMFLYKQRLGTPDKLKDFSTRQPLESVSAMAGAMEKMRVYKDCAVSYYQYRSRTSDEWDRQGKIKERLDNLLTEREALALIAEIDRILYKEVTG